MNWKLELFDAVKKQDIEEVKLIIKNNKYENFNFTDENGKTIIHHAVININEKSGPLLQELIKLDIDLNSVDENFETAIDLAINNNNIIAATILKNKINKEKNN